MATFHLSLPVPSVEESLAFFVGTLGAVVVHRDASGFADLDLHGTQLTLKQSDSIVRGDFHFGVNLTAGEFDALITRTEGDPAVVSPPKVVDAGTPRERAKMYLRCPAGYLIEIKRM